MEYQSCKYLTGRKVAITFGRLMWLVHETKIFVSAFLPIFHGINYILLLFGFHPGSPERRRSYFHIFFKFIRCPHGIILPLWVRLAPSGSWLLVLRVKFWKKHRVPVSCSSAVSSSSRTAPFRTFQNQEILALKSASWRGDKMEEGFWISSFEYQTIGDFKWYNLTNLQAVPQTAWDSGLHNYLNLPLHRVAREQDFCILIWHQMILVMWRVSSEF